MNGHIDFSVEANLGSGKTTLLNKIKELYPEQFNVILEPLEQWTDPEANILDLFYQDQDRWSCTFQTNAHITRVTKFLKNYDSCRYNITERSVESDYQIFAKMLRNDQKLNNVEWKLYLNWKDVLTTHFNVFPKKYIYLRCPPEISYERLRKRNRHEESGVPFEYIKEVHDYHEKWLMESGLENVIVIDAAQDFKSNDNIVREIVSHILSGYDMPDSQSDI